MRKKTKRLLWIGIILALLAAIPAGIWLSLTYQPSYYRAMVLQSRDQREGKARKFVAQSLQLRNDICNEPNWEAVFTDQEVNAWLAERHAAFSPVARILTPGRTIEETVMTLDGDNGRVDVPAAVAADRADDGRIIELRVYWSMWPLTGEHHHRPPLLEPDPDLRQPDVINDYQRALAAGDAEAILATFESDAYVREPAGSAYVHRGRDELLALYQRFFSNDGGIQLEHCTVTDDGRACALEYNLLRWGRTELSPEAGLAVYVRGSSGKLASARIYDDIEPPVGR